MYASILSSIHVSIHLFIHVSIYLIHLISSIHLSYPSHIIHPSILFISYHPSKSFILIHLCMHVLFPAHKLQCSIEEVEEGRDNLRLQLDELNRYNWRIHLINSLPRRLLLWHIHHHRYLFNHIHCSWLFYHNQFHLIIGRNNELVISCTQFAVNQSTLT